MKLLALNVSWTQVHPGNQDEWIYTSQLYRGLKMISSLYFATNPWPRLIFSVFTKDKNDKNGIYTGFNPGHFLCLALVRKKFQSEIFRKKHYLVGQILRCFQINIILISSTVIYFQPTSLSNFQWVKPCIGWCNGYGLWMNVRSRVRIPVSLITFAYTYIPLGKVYSHLLPSPTMDWMAGTVWHQYPCW